MRITYANVAEPIALMSELKALFETVGWEVQAIADLRSHMGRPCHRHEGHAGDRCPRSTSSALAFAMANGKVEAIPHDDRISRMVSSSSVSAFQRADPLFDELHPEVDEDARARSGRR